MDVACNEEGVVVKGEVAISHQRQHLGQHMDCCVLTAKMVCGLGCHDELPEAFQLAYLQHKAGELHALQLVKNDG